MTEQQEDLRSHMPKNKRSPALQRRPRATTTTTKKHVHIYTGGGGGIPIIIYGLFPLFMNNYYCLLASAFSHNFNWLTSLIFLMSLNYSFVKSKPLKPQLKFSTVRTPSPNPSFPTQASDYLQVSCRFPHSHHIPLFILVFMPLRLPPTPLSHFLQDGPQQSFNI